MTAKTNGALSRLKAAAFLAAVTFSPLTALASDATGVWMNDTGRGAIEIKPCGAALCGHVVWVKDGSDAKGCGRQIIGDATAISGNTYGNGWIYSPERKRRYDVEFKPLDDSRLRVIGFAGSKFFSKTMIWKRAPADLQRCGETTAAAKTAAPAETAALPDKTVAPAKTAPTAPKSVGTPARSATAAFNRAAASAAEAQEAPADKPAADTGATAETASDTGEEQVAAADEAPELDGLKDKLGKYLKRDGDKCKLNLPWVKVDFKCE